MQKGNVKTGHAGSGEAMQMDEKMKELVKKIPYPSETPIILSTCLSDTGEILSEEEIRNKLAHRYSDEMRERIVRYMSEAKQFFDSVKIQNFVFEIRDLEFYILSLKRDDETGRWLAHGYLCDNEASVPITIEFIIDIGYHPLLSENRIATAIKIQSETINERQMKLLNRFKEILLESKRR